MTTQLPASFLPEKFRILSGSVLKLIAIILMLIDHTGLMILYNYPATTATLFHFGGIDYSWYRIFRDIGRAAFPIFCFLLVEGFIHTHDVKKYAQRLFLFALISEIPFDFALKPRWFYPGKQNVYFTLLIGLLVLWGVAVCNGQLVIQLLILVSGLLAASFLQTDYSFKGVFLIEVLYIFRSSRLYQCLCGAAAISWEIPAPAAFLPVFFYNGKRGISLKYFFYWFYPVHLVLLGIITKFVLPLFR